MLKYKVDLTQDDIDAIWVVSNFVEGTGIYKECIDNIREQLRPFISDKIKGCRLVDVCKGNIIFTGEYL